MNRIYQGRVSDIQIIDSDGQSHTAPLGNSENCPLWQHHQIFQDAVNYNLVALGSLADSNSENRVIRDLRARLEESWEKFPRNQYGALSLRDSLRRSMPELGSNATLQDAFDLILSGNESTAQGRTLALTLILAKCGGDAAIQQGGRAYLPRLCDAKCNPTWDYSSSARESASGAARLASILHAESSKMELEAIAREMDLSWVVKVQPGKSYIGQDAKVRLKEAINHLLKQLSNPSPRLAKSLSSVNDDPEIRLRGYLEDILEFPENLTIPRNRKAAPDLTFAAIAFKYFPSSITQCFLKQGIKAPKPASIASSTKKTDDELFTSLGDDPIKLARHNRAYVFPAYTALPQWSPLTTGDPVWKEFDIAAFKEALKSLNQFNQKTIERDEKLRTAKQTLDYMLGRSDTLPKTSEGDEESKVLSQPGKDPRWPKIAELEKELGENLNEGCWQLSRSSLRGLRDIVELWNKKPEASTQELQQIVKTYQADDKHKREIGSVQLFLLLCEERYRDLWHSDSKLHDDKDADPAMGILSHAIQVHQLEREVLRFREPIRLTPAEPSFSRRLFMFSDLKDKLAKVKFGESTKHGAEDKIHYLETAIALKREGGMLETRVRINFTAPRLSRDELLSGGESRWLQPMTSALGLSQPQSNGKFNSAVALMPDKSGDSIRHLLNFPVNLETIWLHEALGKSAIWRGQFNGTKDKNLHLHWPTTAKDSTKKNPWWENKEIIKNGFTILSNDLGQRSAGAWALLKVTCWKPETIRPFHSIGHDGKREWFAEIIKNGMYRLPGEDQLVQNNGTWTTEKSGKKGRMPSDEDYTAISCLASKLGCEAVENWLGIHGERSFPELNDQLIKIANRRLTRLATYHRWSCFAPEKLEDPARREKVIEDQIVELEAYQDESVLQWVSLLKSRDITRFQNETGNAFEKLRYDLETHLVNLANLTVPLRKKLWTWQQRSDDTQYGDLLMVNFDDFTAKIRGQRGLSMLRLEQLEGLRRLFLRYNRSMDRKPGIPASFGRDDKGRTSGEPCQALLDKIDQMKEQRVNQTAHLILAQALGVKLRRHQISDDERQNRDIHGEYEKIAGREPVDFIVIEDLSRYLSSQGRAPSENSRLMKWAHRAVRDKLKMLSEEPFGIPVVETVPAYSSRFHSVNGQPGSRLYELQNIEKFQLQALEKLASKTERHEQYRASAARSLAEQFRILAQTNAQRKIANKKPLTLYFPKAGGPLFLAARDGNPIQADLNAAANLGLRAIAAPECIAIHRRVRARSEKGCLRPRIDNAREKAAFAKEDVIQLGETLSKVFGKSTSPNFFYEPDELTQADGKPLFDQATLQKHMLVSGVALWSTVNNAIYTRCVQLNHNRLKTWGLHSESQLSAKIDEHDDIPM